MRAGIQQEGTAAQETNEKSLEGSLILRTYTSLDYGENCNTQAYFQLRVSICTTKCLWLTGILE